MRRLLPLAAALLLLAGCGSPSSYRLAATHACLAKQTGVRLSGKVDFVASTASVGAFTVFLRRNEVTISFGRDTAEAEQLAKGYRRVHGKNIGIEDVLKPARNVVMLWAAHPSDKDLGTVQGCLK